MDIRSGNDLEALMEVMAREALEEIREEVLRLFRADYIRKYVYDSHGGNEVYHDDTQMPTYQFEEAWEWTEIERLTDVLVTEMWYNHEEMDFDRSTYLHGSKYSKPNDVRYNLMRILDKKGWSSDLWLSVWRPVAYWDAFMTDMIDRGELEKIITKHFLSKGFTRV